MKYSRNALFQEIQQSIEPFSEWLVGLLAEQQDTQLMSTAQRKKQLHLKINDYLTQFSHKLSAAQQIIKHAFEEEDKKLHAVNSESSFAVWEKISKQLEETLHQKLYSTPILAKTEVLQEQLGIPWPFMHRVYELGKRLLQEAHYEDAENIFFFLCCLNPAVFEYWLMEATCQHALEHIEQAVELYAISLTLKPKHPIVFLQLARCFYINQQPECCRQCLNRCIQYANENVQFTSIAKEAEELLKVIPK